MFSGANNHSFISMTFKNETIFHDELMAINSGLGYEDRSRFVTLAV